QYGVASLVYHLGGDEDLALWRRCRPDEWRQGCCHALLTVEKEAMRPQGRLPVEVGRLQPVLPVEAEVDVGDRPLLRLPPAVEVHVAGHVFDATIDEGEDVIDPDVAELLEACAADAVEVDGHFGIQCRRGV